MSSLPNEMNVFRAKTCWVKFRKEATFALYTPFIVSLASGNLNSETFKQCIAQSIHFLKPFAQAFKLAERYAEDDDAKHGINELRKTALKKLNMHDYFVEEWDSDVDKDTPPNPATSKCTDFLLATASGKIDGMKAILSTPFEKTRLSGYILGAMTSCIRLYAYIGKELQGVVDHESYHRYRKFKNYSSGSFQDFSVQAEDLLDMLSVSFTLDELDIVERLYSRGIKHEINFFLAQPLTQKVVVPLSGEHNRDKRQLMIFSDFDLTCTFADSSAVLAELAILTARKSDQSQTENQIASHSDNLKKLWKLISEKYTDGYNQCIKNMLATEKAEKLNYEGLRKALEQLSDFEKEANFRVSKCRVLKGLKLENIQRAGELWTLQDGCLNFFQTIKNKENLNADVYMLSYCWCGYLIRSVLSKGGLNDLKVDANELEFEASLSTGVIVEKMQSPFDKVQAFGKILESCREGNDKKKPLTVYIGHALGDLLCLLEADVGIVVGSSPGLRSVGEHFGVRFIPLFNGVIDKQKEFGEVEEADTSSSSTWKGLSGILYTVSTWAEIHAFVIGS
ncbi:bifunctional TH2 protein, mitochondrial-like [Ipomoea triloba]|uniref:bifunctional TH2 protein, mitochondrial-like n=1 Tax=Ipomoea triloba TaxID=35885 RepID=UPI00125D9781|nr:bifunctional TH2 protein, mitochondrial-like [Ipomoea triloba]